MATRSGCSCALTSATQAAFSILSGRRCRTPDPAVALTALFEGVIAHMTEGAPSRGCLTTKTAIELPLAGKAIEARVKRLIEDFAALIRDALSTPAARRKLSCEPDIAATLRSPSRGDWR